MQKLLQTAKLGVILCAGRGPVVIVQLRSIQSHIHCFIFQFECQQAQLEAEIENLSWKIEHAEITDRGDLENQVSTTLSNTY